MAIFQKKSVFSIVLMSVLLSACTPGEADESKQPPQQVISKQFDVYKSPTCGCCTEWITHTEKRGFSSNTFHPADLTAQKEALGVARQYHSCHTAVTKEGYVFEGHVPARLIEKFLQSPPKGALGLAVPGMPAGSPGMEMGDRFTPYEVLLLKKDGSSEVYEAISKQSEQY